MEKDICREQICLSEGKEKGAVLFNTLYHFYWDFIPTSDWKKVITLLQFTTNSAVLAFQVSILDGCVGESVPSWLTNVSVFGIITCTDVQWVNPVAMFQNCSVFLYSHFELLIFTMHCDWRGNVKKAACTCM